MSGWCTIESDPGVFTELVSEFGVLGVQVEEMYSLDADSMLALGAVHGLIFLFKWRQEKDDRSVSISHESSLFFAQQMVTNACATQAILAILLNRPEVELGEELTAFKAFTKEFPPELKGLAISNSELLRKAHNSFTRPEPFIGEERHATKDDDIYHFISYVPAGGKLWELDGLKSGPICLGAASEAGWLDVVRPIIQKRMEAYSTKEIRFNLMAVIVRHHPRPQLPADCLDTTKQSLRHLKSVFDPRPSCQADRRVALQDQQATVEKERNMTVGKIQARSGKLPTATELDKLATGTPPPPSMGEVAVDDRSVGELFIALAHLTRRSGALAREIDLESQKAEQWKLENRRRKHNYAPFIVKLLKLLADRGELLPLVDATRTRKKKR